MPPLQTLEIMNMARTTVPRLLQLMRDNLETRRHTIRGAASDDEATIYLYDVLDPFWGISAADFVKELNALTAPTIHLRINSPGGSVFEARAIVTAIKSHPSKIIAHVDGVAASAATVVAVAADEVEMAQGALFMIHNAWAITIGNSEDMLAMAALLEKADESIVTDYVKKTKKPKDEISAWMRAETWFTAEEAMDAGFVDRIYEGESVENAWDLAAFENAPKPRARSVEDDLDREASAQRAHAERRLRLLEKCAA